VVTGETGLKREHFMNAIRVRRHCMGIVRQGSKDSDMSPYTPRPCPGWAHGQSEYCYPHDPAITQEERRSNAVRGGHAGRGKRRIKLGTAQGFKTTMALAWNALLNRGDRTSEGWDHQLLGLMCVLARLQVTGWKLELEKVAAQTNAGHRTVRIITTE
jgi:hypothetical protein